MKEIHLCDALGEKWRPHAVSKYMDPYEWGYADGFEGDSSYLDDEVDLYRDGWWDGYNAALAILSEDEVDAPDV